MKFYKFSILIYSSYYKRGIINVITCIFTLLILTGCIDHCLDPDDFQSHTFVVPAYFSKDKLEGEGTLEVAPWLDTKLYANGDPIAMVVNNWIGVASKQTETDLAFFNSYSDSTLVNKNNYEECSAWCPWYDPPINSDKKLSEIAYRLPTCIFKNNQMCHDGEIAKITNAPCLFKRGVGLYGLIAKPRHDPNESYVTKKGPLGKTFHIGQWETSKDKPYHFYKINKKGVLRDAGGIIYDPKKFDNDSEEDPQAPDANSGGGTDEDSRIYSMMDHKIYLKILDRHYSDNSGQYIVTIKSGFKDYNTNFLDNLVNDITDIIFGDRTSTKNINAFEDRSSALVPKLYNRIIKNPNFKAVVRILCILSVMILSINFMIGTSRISSVELVSQTAKISAIAMLLSTDQSWRFFNDYLFTFFIEGSSFLKDLVMSKSTSHSIITLIFSVNTVMKLFALCFTSLLGPIYVLIYLFALCFFAFSIFNTYIAYIISIMVLGLIIIMGPIFISMILFKQTRYLFDNWIKQMMYYALQPMFLFLGISISSIIVTDVIYKSLGFPVCKKHFFAIPNLNITDPTSYDPEDNVFPIVSFLIPKTNDSFRLQTIPVPNGVIDMDNKVHPPYSVFDKRFPDLPYLKPETQYDSPMWKKGSHDQYRINRIRKGHFLFMEDLLIMIAAAWLLMKYNIQVERMAKMISNAAAMTSISSVQQKAVDSMQSSVGGAVRFGGGGLQMAGSVASMVGSSRYFSNQPNYVSRNAFEGAYLGIKNQLLGGALRSTGIIATQLGRGLEFISPYIENPSRAKHDLFQLAKYSSTQMMKGAARSMFTSEKKYRSQMLDLLKNDQIDQKFVMDFVNSYNQRYRDDTRYDTTMAANHRNDEYINANAFNEYREKIFNELNDHGVNVTREQLKKIAGSKYANKIKSNENIDSQATNKILAKYLSKMPYNVLKKRLKDIYKDYGGQNNTIFSGISNESYESRFRVIPQSDNRIQGGLRNLNRQANPRSDNHIQGDLHNPNRQVIPQRYNRIQGGLGNFNEMESDMFDNAMNSLLSRQSTEYDLNTSLFELYKQQTRLKRFMSYAFNNDYDLHRPIIRNDGNHG